MMKKLKTPPNEGDIRIVRKFAWYPIFEYDRNNEYYFCWWEYYYIKKVYKAVAYPDQFGTIEKFLQWVTIDRWILTN